mmetsp:Transcript_44169/g.116949  ORF Transcript_44169/g.116949 Transcript_44169/m.116949 type:complete len:103 (+) Transcript_44169:511-819(+)
MPSKPTMHETRQTAGPGKLAFARLSLTRNAETLKVVVLLEVALASHSREMGPGLRYVADRQFLALSDGAPSAQGQQARHPVVRPRGILVPCTAMVQERDSVE